MKTSIERRIRQRLLEKQLSISGLASEIGVSRVALYHLFKGNYSREMLEKISKVLDIPVHVLLTPFDSSSEDRNQCLISAYNAASENIRHAVDMVLNIDEGDATAQGRPVVVVVDDLADNAELLHRSLRKEYDVLQFTDPALALAEIRRSHVDAIVSDQRMPNMNGTDFLAEVTALHRPIAKVIVSAYSDNEALVDAINRAKIDAFLMKPIQPSELRKHLKEVLRRIPGPATAVAH